MSAPEIKGRAQGKIRINVKWNFGRLMAMLKTLVLAFVSLLALLGGYVMDTCSNSILCNGVGALLLVPGGSAPFHD